MCEIRFPAYLMSPTILNPLLFRSEALERQNLFFAQQRASGSILGLFSITMKDKM